jgi:hypothetical protein
MARARSPTVSCTDGQLPVTAYTVRALYRVIVGLTQSRLWGRADRSGLCMSLVGPQLIACGGLDTRALPRDGAEAGTASVPWTELDEMRQPRADFGAAAIHMYSPL